MTVRAQGPDSISSTRAGVWVLAALLAPFVLRGAALLDSRIELGIPDLHGFLSDLGLGLLVAAVSAAATRRSRWLGVGLLVLWVVGGQGNYEHVVTNGANLSLADAGNLADATFVLGSALRPTAPGLLVSLLAITVLLAWLALRRGRLYFPWLLIGSAGLIVTAVSLSWSENLAALAWRQQHFVAENVRRATRDPLLPLGEAELRTGDLRGRPWLDLGRAGRNVLLILVEGISGAHLPAVTAANGVELGFALPQLDRLARENVYYTSFIAQQRQTNRGQYALLCGDYPKLLSGSPKMSEHLVAGEITCLPESMAAAGYQTVYLQAAPLAYMLKDQFMPRIGFSAVHGDEWFEAAYRRSRWGVDDRAFFEQSVRMVDQLQRSGKPWFLTLLTAGTHHPFTLPRDYRAADGSTGFRRAAAYADEALGSFVRALERAGVLEQTLILITSDESAGIQAGADDLARTISQSWGFMIALLPERTRRRIDDPYMQLDVPISILDYLGLSRAASDFTGRSMFRHYTAGRMLAFGNTYRRIVGALNPAGHLLLCGEDFEGCLAWETVDGLLFSRERRRMEPVAPSEIEELRRVVRRTLRLRESAREIYELIGQRVVRVLDELVDEQLVFGGQFLFVPAGTRVEVEIDVELQGNDGKVSIYHDLTSRGDVYHYSRRVADMRPGDGFRVRYSYTPEQPLEKLENRFMVRRLSGRNLSLNFKTARMRLMPRAQVDTAERAGFELHELTITRTE